MAVVGHSEGSLIGMIAAKESGADAFVSVSGPSRGAAMVLRQQLARKLSETLVKRNEAILTALEEGADRCQCAARFELALPRQRTAVPDFVVSLCAGGGNCQAHHPHADTPRRYRHSG